MEKKRNNFIVYLMSVFYFSCVAINFYIFLNFVELHPWSALPFSLIGGVGYFLRWRESGFFDGIVNNKWDGVER